MGSRPPMPFFLDIPNHRSPIDPIPTKSTYQPLAITPIASTSSNEVDKIEAMVQVMMQKIDKNMQDQSSNLEKRLQDQVSKIGKEV